MKSDDKIKIEEREDNVWWNAYYALSISSFAHPLALLCKYFLTIEI